MIGATEYGPWVTGSPQREGHRGEIIYPLLLAPNGPGHTPSWEVLSWVPDPQYNEGVFTHHYPTTFYNFHKSPYEYNAYAPGKRISLHSACLRRLVQVCWREGLMKSLSPCSSHIRIGRPHTMIWMYWKDSDWQWTRSLIRTTQEVLLWFFLFHSLLVSGLTFYSFTSFPQNAICLNTASLLYTVHGPIILFPPLYYGCLLLFMCNPYVASSLLSHSPAFPLHLS